VNQEEIINAAAIVESSKNVCYKCGAVNHGIPYTVSPSGKHLKIRKLPIFKKGMHSECATAWIERVRVMPSSTHEVPEIAEAYREYEERVERGAREIEKIRSEVASCDEYLSSVVRHYHTRQIEALKTGEPSRPLDRKLLGCWKSWCARTPNEERQKSTEEPTAITQDNTKNVKVPVFPTLEAIDRMRKQIDLWITLRKNSEEKLQNMTSAYEAFTSDGVVVPFRRRQNHDRPL